MLQPGTRVRVKEDQVMGAAHVDGPWTVPAGTLGTYGRVGHFNVMLDDPMGPREITNVVIPESNLEIVDEED